MGDRLRVWFGTSRDIVVASANQFGRDRVGRMAAAIAYRTVFALAPLLIIAVSVLGAILGGSEAAQAELLETIAEVAGQQVADFLADFLESAILAGNTAALIGAGLLVWTASSLFLEVQHDLNDIFRVPYDHISGMVALVKNRGIGLLWTFGLGLIILAVWFLNALWRFVEGLFPESLTGLHTFLGYMTPLASVVILPFLFGLVFQTMTAAKVRWRAVWWGGLFTAVVFVLAAYGIGIYFALFDTPTALGFASSLVVVLFLAYLLSSVFLFGAEVTKAYSDHLDRLEAGPPARSGPPGILVATPDESVPRFAILAFLAGLILGFRRSRR